MAQSSTTGGRLDLNFLYRIIKFWQFWEKIGDNFETNYEISLLIGSYPIVIPEEDVDAAIQISVNNDPSIAHVCIIIFDLFAWLFYYRWF